MGTLAIIHRNIVEPRTEAEILDFLRLKLSLLADAYGGHIGLFVKVRDGELSPSEQMVYTKATMHINSVGAQFF